MPRFEFSLSSPAVHNRLAGAVTSASFSEALEAITDQVDLDEGDTLEIGVKGFPPARFEYRVSGADGSVTWCPTGQLAA
jgi:hypothetical protein